jgi:hypothetical protein
MDKPSGNFSDGLSFLFIVIVFVFPDFFSVRNPPFLFLSEGEYLKYITIFFPVKFANLPAE